MTANPPPLDPDPLYVGADPIINEAFHQAGWDEGYEQGIADSLPPMGVIVLAACTGVLLGVVLTVGIIS